MLFSGVLPRRIQLGVASLALVGMYPFMKRVTFWPQAVLGMAMNYGILMGWSAVQGGLSTYILPMYAGAVCWTIVYDTIYAHQDKRDDEKLGLKSTAILFGERTKPILTCFAAAFGGGLATSGVCFSPDRKIEMPLASGAECESMASGEWVFRLLQG